MNSCKEFEGKNVETAVELACKTLNIDKSKLKYDIITNGSSGIFSIIGKKNAKIRVMLETSNKNKQRVLSLVDEAFGVNKKTTEKSFESKPEKKNKSEYDRPKKKQTRQNNISETKNEKPVFEPKEKNEPSEKIELKERIISDFYKGKNPEEIGKEVIEHILKFITDIFEVTLEKDDEGMIYHISSEESAVIIGKRGQNLEAMQYIVDKIVNKHSLERQRVLIDVEGYLEKRRDNLEKMAIRMSEKVKKTGKPSTISQMSSQDRRIVHLALKDNKNVRTQSMGEGYYRRLVIFPKKGRPRKKKA